MLPVVLALGAFDWLLLIVLAGLLVAVIALLRRGRATQTGPQVGTGAPPANSLADLGVTDARAGDQVSVRGAGRDYDDLTFVVEKVNRYEWGDHRWFELVGRTPDGRVFLEWEQDDELVVSLSRPEDSRRIEQLGLTEDDLVRFDEQQSSANTVTVDGTSFHYAMSSEVGFFDGGTGAGEGFYLWSFETDSGDRAVSIEKWQGEPFEASLGTRVSPEDVRVYRG